MKLTLFELQMNSTIQACTVWSVQAAGGCVCVWKHKRFSCKIKSKSLFVIKTLQWLKSCCLYRSSIPVSVWLTLSEFYLLAMTCITQWCSPDGQALPWGHSLWLKLSAFYLLAMTCITQWCSPDGQALPWGHILMALALKVQASALRDVLTIFWITVKLD